MHEIKELVGQTIKKSSLYPKSGDDVLDIVTENFRYRLYHDQDCCESVAIERVSGVEYLFGKVLEVEETYPDIPYDHESYTWTNYKFVTENGICEILWLGYSNGYYSESVSLDRTNLTGFELIQPVLTDEFQPTETDHNPTHSTKEVSMVVSVISSIKFKLDEDSHTVSYSKACKQLEHSDKSEMFGRFRAVITDTPEEGIKKLAQQISELLQLFYFKPRPADFEFQVQTSEVYNGEFWLMPFTSDCKTYNVQKIMDS